MKLSSPFLTIGLIIKMKIYIYNFMVHDKKKNHKKKNISKSEHTAENVMTSYREFERG